MKFSENLKIRSALGTIPPVVKSHGSAAVNSGFEFGVRLSVVLFFGMQLANTKLVNKGIF